MKRYAPSDYMIDVDDESTHVSKSELYVAIEDLPRWIPVSERLPEENVQVLAYSPDDEDGDLHVCSWGVERKPFMEPRGYFSRLDFKTIWGVTHWMPLPEPPTE